MLFGGIPTQWYGNERNKSWAQPSRSDHAHGRVGVHEVIIVKWLADGVESIDKKFNEHINLLKIIENVC